jgi:hypothetical protein
MLHISLTTLFILQRFTALLQAIAASRDTKKIEDDPSAATFSTECSSASSSALPIEEVKEIITIHSTGTTASSPGASGNQVDPEALDQLEEYITIIAGMYDYHAFHK